MLVGGQIIHLHTFWAKKYCMENKEAQGIHPITPCWGRVINVLICGDCYFSKAIADPWANWIW